MACILMVLYKVFEDYPIVAAANRDEFYDRHGIAPDLIETKTKIRVWAPRDRKQEGSWIGVNENGILVALTNKLSDATSGEQSSRGYLVLEALSKINIFNIDQLVEAEHGKYNYFNIVYADKNNAYIRSHTEKGLSDPQELGEGINILTTSVNDRNDERTDNAFNLLTNIKNETLEAAISRLKLICTDKEKGIFIREESFGTISSVIFAVGYPSSQNICFYAEHTKDSIGKFENYSHIFKTKPKINK